MTGSHEDLTSTEYEILCRNLMDGIGAVDGVQTISVRHNVKLPGKAMEHQIDVVWDYVVEGVEHRRVFECKHWKKNVENTFLSAWKTTVDDLVEPAEGVFITRTGYQSGATKVASYYGISIWTFRAPLETDWEGRVRTITVDIGLMPDIRVTDVVIDWEVPDELEGTTVAMDSWLIHLPDGPIVTVAEIVRGWVEDQPTYRSAEELPQHEREFSSGTALEVPVLGGALAPIRSFRARAGRVTNPASAIKVVVRGDEIVEWVAHDIFGDEHFLVQHDGTIRRVDAT